MSKRSINVAMLPLVKKDPAAAGDPFLEVTVRFESGGANYFNGSSSPRGFYLSMVPVTVEDSPFGKAKSFTLFHGKKLLLAEAARFNAKALDKAAAGVLLHPKFPDMMADVLATEGDALAPEAIGPALL